MFKVTYYIGDKEFNSPLYLTVDIATKHLNDISTYEGVSQAKVVDAIAFCDKCNKVVPTNELRELLPTSGNFFHYYTKTVNAYKNQRPGTIGCCLVEESVFCGKIREPNAQEYFIYHTLNMV